MLLTWSRHGAWSRHHVVKYGESDRIDLHGSQITYFSWMEGYWMTLVYYHLLLPYGWQVIFTATGSDAERGMNEKFISYKRIYCCPCWVLLTWLDYKWMLFTWLTEMQIFIMSIKYILTLNTVYIQTFYRVSGYHTLLLHM